MVVPMREPVFIRCARCDALVPLIDASRCQIHQTDPLCTFCWKDHWMRHEGDNVPEWETCWAEAALPLNWR